MRIKLYVWSVFYLRWSNSPTKIVNEYLQDCWLCILLDSDRAPILETDNIKRVYMCKNFFKCIKVCISVSTHLDYLCTYTYSNGVLYYVEKYMIFEGKKNISNFFLETKYKFLKWLFHFCWNRMNYSNGFNVKPN